MQKTIVGVGEILWDLIGDEKHLGGAPANFAYHAGALGDLGIPAGRIGHDRLGDAIRAVLRPLGVPLDYVQVDRRLPTGTVLIKLSASGQPTFTITPDVAWDNLRPTLRLLRLAREADAVCFGTLAQRSPTSRRTIRRVVAAAQKALVICDLNLRAEFLALDPDDGERMDIVERSLEMAHVLKLNDDELCILRRALEWNGSDDAFLLRLIREFGLRMVCVTLGARGCILRTPRQRVRAAGRKVRVADTVGSGDAFTAAMVNRLLRRRPLAEVARFANRLGAYVASRSGATPPLDGFPRRRTAR